MKPILIDAVYIHVSGALMILNHLVNRLTARGVNFVLLKDRRCPTLQSEDDIPNITVLDPSLKARNSYYRWHRDSFSSILCLANVPPPVKMHAKVITYIHNVNLLDIPSGLRFRSSVYSHLKRHYIRFISRNTDQWAVQTLHTASLVDKHINHKRRQILIYPFFNIPDSINHTPHEMRQDYVFIGEATGAKGHEHLIEAWARLGEKGFDKTLHLTTSAPELVEPIDRALKRGARIINHGFISFDEVIRLYNKSKAIIYPSLNESLGLGIIEGAEAGCDVIGCNLPYLHCVCEPSACFRPSDPDSIIDAILRYESGNAKPTTLRIRDHADEFIDVITGSEPTDKFIYHIQ